MVELKKGNRMRKKKKSETLVKGISIDGDVYSIDYIGGKLAESCLVYAGRTKREAIIAHLIDFEFRWLDEFSWMASWRTFGE